MNFLLEIKNRIFLLIFIWFYSIFSCYYYKKVLFFILLNKSILNNQKLQIYFVYTNITELFFIYLKLINFITLQVVFWFFCYHFLIFVTPALYKNESAFFKKLTIILLINWYINFLTIVFFIFPVTWEFFENFQKIFIINLVHFEIKINEYLKFFIETYFILQFYISCFITIIFLFKNFYYNKIYTKKYRKFNYTAIVFMFILLNPINLINQTILYSLFVIYYETSLIFYFFNFNLIKN